MLGPIGTRQSIISDKKLRIVPSRLFPVRDRVIRSPDQLVIGSEAVMREGPVRLELQRLLVLLNGLIPLFVVVGVHAYIEVLLRCLRVCDVELRRGSSGLDEALWMRGIADRLLFLTHRRRWRFLRGGGCLFGRLLRGATGEDNETANDEFRVISHCGPALIEVRACYHRGRLIADSWDRLRGQSDRHCKQYRRFAPAPTATRTFRRCPRSQCDSADRRP